MASTGTGPRATLRHRDFRLLLLATTMQTVVMPMQFVSLTFWAIDTYPDQKVLFPSLISGARGVGLLGMALVGGAIADRFERRRVLIVCEAVTAASTALLAVLMIGGFLGDWTIAAVVTLALVAAAVMGVDQPARSASIPSIVPKAEVAAAIGLSSVAGQLAFPVVLPLAGYLNDRFQPGEVLLFSLSAWAVIFPALAAARYSSLAADVEHRSFIADIREGLAYVSATPAIRGVLLIVFVIHVVGMPGVGMLGPLWMREVLGLSASQFGFIAMLWGVGALVSSFAVAQLHGSAGRGLLLGGAGLLFGLSAAVFSHSREPLLTAAANFVLGFAMIGAMVIASIIVQHLVAEGVRGRVMGLFPLIMGVSMVNVLAVGAAAQEWGMVVIVPTLSWATLAGVAFILLGSGALRRARAVAPGVMPAALPIDP